MFLIIYLINLIKSSKDGEEAKKVLLGKTWSANDIADLINMIGDPTDEIDDKGMYKLSSIQVKQY